VLVERSCDLRQIFAGERLTASNDQNAKIGAERFADPHDLCGRHLQLLAWLIVEFVGEEAMDTTHVTDRRDENVQQDRCKRAACSHSGVPFEYFFVVEIHVVERTSITRYGLKTYWRLRHRRLLHFKSEMQQRRMIQPPIEATIGYWKQRPLWARSTRVWRSR